MDNLSEVPTDIKLELDSLRRYLNISDVDRFNKGVAFVNSCLDGEKQYKAYMIAFNCTKEEAQKNSSSFHRSKWVQEIFKFYKPEEGSLYIGEIQDIIREGMRIIRDPLETSRNKTEAMRALQPYIKAEKAEAEDNISKDPSASESAINKLTEQIETLVDNGKMISPDGNVIDVDFIE